MTCRELISFLDDYLDGSLTPATQAAFDDHINICTDCQRYLTQYRGTIALSKAAFADLDAAPPKEVPSALIKAGLAARGCASGSCGSVHDESH